ncbi:hypothetical protein [Streptomyces sp. NBC_01197]|uniref:hypothetical protein n=1 Tax=Streptomyces sp. NBC_01197 TaxID=2903768 RepID=UPI002E1449CA|nr:hypothetical protein OG452_34905 [Streptomyces sp. NBC_01197]
MYLTPRCPDCSTATERIEVEGEEVWRCTAPDCTRRTYGTGDPDDDDALPPYTETDETGAVLIHHGTGEVDVEATVELAAQDGHDEDDDLVDEEQPAPATGAPGRECARGTVRVPGSPPWGRLPGVGSAPDPEGALTVFTESDDGVGLEPQRPHGGAGHGPLPPNAGPSPRGHG